MSTLIKSNRRENLKAELDRGMEKIGGSIKNRYDRVSDTIGTTDPVLWEKTRKELDGIDNDLSGVMDEVSNSLKLEMKRVKDAIKDIVSDEKIPPTNQTGLHAEKQDRDPYNQPYK